MGEQRDLAAMGPLSVLSPLISIWAAVYYWKKRRKFTAIVLFLIAPMSLSFIFGTVAYLRGTARLQYMGYPSEEFHNLDPELRCGRSTGGCIVTGNEWLFHEPYNSAVRLMTNLFGWMPGTYTGPYPTLDQSRDALRNGSEVPLEILQRDRIPLDGKEIVVTQGKWKYSLVNYSHEFANQELPPLKATVWKDKCVVLRIPAQSTWDYEDVAGRIFLFDRETGDSFAMYLDEHGPQQ